MERREIDGAHLQHAHAARLARGMAAVSVHPSAEVSPNATIGDGTRIWHHAQIREGAHVGSECVIGKNVYIGSDVRIGDACKIENNAAVFDGVTIGRAVFVGPGAILTNDRIPRAATPAGRPKGASDWAIESIEVKDGASLGAGAIVIAGVSIGEYALVAAGSVVTRDVPPFGLVRGNPARLAGFTCRCGHGRFSVAPKDGDARCDLCRVAW